MADVRLIDAACLKRELEENRDEALRDGKSSLYVDAINTAIHILNCTPTIDPESLRPVGHWANSEDFFGNPYVWTCTNCAESLVMEDWGKPQDSNYKFCPYCGAKMEDDTHDQPNL